MQLTNTLYNIEQKTQHKKRTCNTSEQQVQKSAISV